jgi:hypothetical protein
MCFPPSEDESLAGRLDSSVDPPSLPVRLPLGEDESLAGGIDRRVRPPRRPGEDDGAAARLKRRNLGLEKISGMNLRWGRWCGEWESDLSNQFRVEKQHGIRNPKGHRQQYDTGYKKGRWGV